jgi:hypothetical protein
MTTNTIKADRVKKLLYKRPALAILGYDMITSELYEIQSACGDVQWFIDSDDDTLLNALDGNEEDEYEFRMAFSDLIAKADALDNAMRDSVVREMFDDCTVSLIGNRYKTIGYDSMEEDYFSLTSFEQELAFTESGQRLMRKTKQEMIASIGQCLGVTIAFLDLRQAYDYLKATLDILRDENTSILQTIKAIEDAYCDAEKADFSYYRNESKRFDLLLSSIPDRIWIE